MNSFLSTRWQKSREKRNREIFADTSPTCVRWNAWTYEYRRDECVRACVRTSEWAEECVSSCVPGEVRSSFEDHSEGGPGILRSRRGTRRRACVPLRESRIENREYHATASPPRRWGVLQLTLFARPAPRPLRYHPKLIPFYEYTILLFSAHFPSLHGA